MCKKPLSALLCTLVIAAVATVLWKLGIGKPYQRSLNFLIVKAPILHPKRAASSLGWVFCLLREVRMLSLLDVGDS